MRGRLSSLAGAIGRAATPGVVPAHGPPIDDPAAVLARYEAHRRARIRQVEEALRERPDADARELLDVVYPEPLPDRVRRAALLSVEALVHHVQGR